MSAKIEEIVKLDIEESVSGYSAFINDMRISKSKPLSISKTIMSFDCPKKDILSAIGIPEGAVVLTREKFEEVLVNYVPQECIDEICKELIGE